MNWNLGKIVDMKEQYCPYHYYKFHVKQKGLTSPISILSIPIQEGENSRLQRLISNFGNLEPNEIIEKEVYYRNFRKENPNHNLAPFNVISYADFLPKEVFEKFEHLFRAIDGLIEEDGEYKVTINYLEKMLDKFIKRYKIHKIKSDEKPAKIGGLIEIRKLGYVSPIQIFDFENFYPSIFLENGLRPYLDNWDIFQETLTFLYYRKLELQDSEDYFDDIRKIKILMNSLIGALNNPEFIFYDPKLYKEIVKRGNSIMEKVRFNIKELSKNNPNDYIETIRIHTDGIMIRAKKEFAIENVYKGNSWIFKPTLKLKYIGTYSRGLFKDVNNYVLYNPGEVIIKGSFFKGFDLILTKFLFGYFPRNLEEYENEKKELISKDKTNKKLNQILEFLERLK